MFHEQLRYLQQFSHRDPEVLRATDVLTCILIPNLYVPTHQMQMSLIRDGRFQVDFLWGTWSACCNKAYSYLECSPQCFLVAEDLDTDPDGIAYTTQQQALVSLACTAPVQFCQSCLRVSGPSSSTVSLLGTGDVGTVEAVWRMLIRWPSSFSGLLQIDAQSQR